MNGWVSDENENENWKPAKHTKDETNKKAITRQHERSPPNKQTLGSKNDDNIICNYCKLNTHTWKAK